MVGNTKYFFKQNSSFFHEYPIEAYSYLNMKFKLVEVALKPTNKNAPFTPIYRVF